MEYRILIINPGSTSTKYAVYDSHMPVEAVEAQDFVPYQSTVFVPLLAKTIRHSQTDLGCFNSISSQIHFRSSLIEDALEKANIPLNSLNCVIGRRSSQAAAWRRMESQRCDDKRP